MLFQCNRASANRLTLLGGFASVMLWWCRESWTIAAVAHHQQTPVLVAVIGRRVIPPPRKMSHIRPQVGLISGRWGGSDMLWVSKTWFISWLWVCCAGVLCDGAEMQVKPSCLRGAWQVCPAHHRILRCRGWRDEQGFGGHFGVWWGCWRALAVPRHLVALWAVWQHSGPCFFPKDSVIQGISFSLCSSVAQCGFFFTLSRSGLFTWVKLHGPAKRFLLEFFKKFLRLRKRLCCCNGVMILCNAPMLYWWTFRPCCLVL